MARTPKPLTQTPAEKVGRVLPSQSNELPNYLGGHDEAAYNKKYGENEIIKLAAQIGAARVDLDKRAILLSKIWDWAERASIEELGAAVSRLEGETAGRSGLERLRASPPEAKYVLRKATQDRRLGAVEFLEKHYSGFLDGTVTRADLKGFDAELYQGLTNWLRTNDMPPDLNLPSARSAPDRDAVIMSAKKSGQLKSDFEQSSGFDMEAFKAHAAAHQWKTRRDRGYGWETKVFDFISKTYSDWIKTAKDAGRPLTQADLRAVDFDLYRRLQKEMSILRGRGESVPDFGLPAAKDASIQGMTESELEKVQLARAAMREANQRRREAGLL